MDEIEDEVPERENNAEEEVAPRDQDPDNLDTAVYIAKEEEPKVESENESPRSLVDEEESDLEVEGSDDEEEEFKERATVTESNEREVQQENSDKGSNDHSFDSDHLDGNDNSHRGTGQTVGTSKDHFSE